MPSKGCALWCICLGLSPAACSSYTCENHLTISAPKLLYSSSPWQDVPSVSSAECHHSAPTAGQHLPCPPPSSPGLTVRVHDGRSSSAFHTYTHRSLECSLAPVPAQSTKKERGEEKREQEERERQQFYKKEKKKGHRARRRSGKQMGLGRGCCTTGGMEI